MKKFSLMKKIYIALLFLGGAVFTTITLLVACYEPLSYLQGKGGLITVGIIVTALFFALAVLEIVSPQKEKRDNDLPMSRVGKKSADQVIDEAIKEENKK